MAHTLIVACSHCGNLLLAKADQKTRTCPYCGSKVDIRKAKKVASAKNVYEASAMLQDLKNRKHFSRRRPY